ncbi:unnamed protein product [Dibothriocephalus latus]|uniref:Uncharacterized protein n=1 Tax=Dibothriocephalus latus TaxID=60516 RepID=A0A3P7MCW0_DIBLA|nr:unnamed protein product [Dibothriocephalus latus]
MQELVRAPILVPPTRTFRLFPPIIASVALPPFRGNPLHPFRQPRTSPKVAKHPQLTRARRWSSAVSGNVKKVGLSDLAKGQRTPP